MIKPAIIGKCHIKEGVVTIVIFCYIACVLGMGVSVSVMPMAGRALMGKSRHMLGEPGRMPRTHVAE
jgi:hypothetical protein